MPAAFHSESKACARCGKIFHRRYKVGLTAWDKQRFCSIKCYGREKKVNTPKSCEVCSKEYVRPAYWSDAQWAKRRYCSPECARSTFSDVRNRQWADEAYKKSMSLAHNPGQPNGQAGIPRLRFRGENSSRWKGGITPEHRRIRTSMEYRMWRMEVLARDRYTCVFCGAKKSAGVKVVLHVDHIKPFAKFPDLRLEVRNGRTLCAPCHTTTDTYSGRRLK